MMFVIVKPNSDFAFGPFGTREEAEWYFNGTADFWFGAKICQLIPKTSIGAAQHCGAKYEAAAV
jgi:hypothetical protein